MRQAPPVGVTCSGGGAWRFVLVLLAASASASIGAWGLLHLGASGPGAMAGAAAVALLAVPITWARSRPAPVELKWTGRTWTAGAREGEVDVMLDLGEWMLVRRRAAGARALWLPVSAAEAGAAWHPLRTALFARRGAPGTVGEEA